MKEESVWGWECLSVRVSDLGGFQCLKEENVWGWVCLSDWSLGAWVSLCLKVWKWVILRVMSEFESLRLILRVTSEFESLRWCFNRSKNEFLWLKFISKYYKLDFYVIKVAPSTWKICPRHCMKKSWTQVLIARVLHWSRVLKTWDASFPDSSEAWQLTKLLGI